MHANNELMKYSLLCIISGLCATTVSKESTIKDHLFQELEFCCVVWYVNDKLQSFYLA